MGHLVIVLLRGVAELKRVERWWDASGERQRAAARAGRRRRKRLMAVHPLSDHFAYFFSRLNPSTTFEAQASSQYATIKALIEDPNGGARALSARCFLQGSYRQATAIHTINDIDIVVLCELWHPPSVGAGAGPGWSRDDIFNAVAAPLFADGRYRAKVKYGPRSMCIKVELGIKVEILPVVYKQGNNDPSVEPFRMYRPEATEMGGRIRSLPPRMVDMEERRGKDTQQLHPDDQDPKTSPIALWTGSRVVSSRVPAVQSSRRSVSGFCR
jgi:hypothetical protein